MLTFYESTEAYRYLSLTPEIFIPQIIHDYKDISTEIILIVLDYPSDKNYDAYNIFLNEIKNNTELKTIILNKNYQSNDEYIYIIIESANISYNSSLSRNSNNSKILPIHFIIHESVLKLLLREL